MTTLSVVIPALNEEDSIQAVMSRVLGLRPALQAAGVGDLELIVVKKSPTSRRRSATRATEQGLSIIL